MTSDELKPAPDDIHDRHNKFVPPVPLIYKRLIEAATDIGWVGKTGKNTDQGYSFRGIDEILRHVSPAFRARGIVVYPRVIDMVVRDHAFKNSTGTRVMLTIEYTFVCAEDGSTLVATTVGEGLDTSDKAANKAMAQAFKYALNQTLALPTDEPDPDSISPQTITPGERLKEVLAESFTMEEAREWVKRAGKELGIALNTLSLDDVEAILAWIEVESNKPPVQHEPQSEADRPAQRPGPEAASAGDEIEMWAELYTLLGADPSIGTKENIEQRVRQMFSLAGRLGVLDGGGTDPLHRYLMEWYGVEHFSELSVKANYQAFEEKAWEEAKAEIESTPDTTTQVAGLSDAIESEGLTPTTGEAPYR